MGEFSEQVQHMHADRDKWLEMEYNVSYAYTSFRCLPTTYVCISNSMSDSTNTPTHVYLPIHSDSVLNVCQAVVALMENT